MATTTLQSSITPRERVLVIGGEGTGKTSNLLHIARRIPNANFYCMDTDSAMERMLTGANASLDARNGGNVYHTLITEWMHYVDVLADYQSRMTRDDWITLDMIAPAWDAVQDYFSEKVFGKSVEQYFFEARAAQKKGNAFDGRKDWGVINRLYKTWAQSLVLKTPGHVYATSPITQVQDDDAKEIKNLFGRYGVKPQGQKHTGHIFHTVLLATKGRVGEWRITTVKDRERAEVENLVVGDPTAGGGFAKTYLQGIAGWKVGVVR